MTSSSARSVRHSLTRFSSARRVAPRICSTGAPSYLDNPESGLSRCRSAACTNFIAAESYHAQALALTVWRASPKPSMPYSTKSPTFKKLGGLRPSPTPAGVPVLSRSPGSSVMNELMYATSWGTEKINERVRRHHERADRRESIRALALGELPAPLALKLTL